MGLKEMAEETLGSFIQPDEWEQAKQKAEKKLEWIISRNGDAGGVRHELWYLAELIAEIITANRFSRYSFEVAQLYREAKEKPTA